MSAPSPFATVRLEWQGDRRFDAGRPGGPTLRLDGSGETGQSPVDALVSALAACTAIDVVDILAKRRTPVATFAMDAVGTRSDGVPRRVIAVALTYHVTGDGIERLHAERAIELAITKYCSVRDSLDPMIPVRYALVLNGQSGDTRIAGTAG